MYFAIGRKTKLILNYHIGDRDYRDVITFKEYLRKYVILTKLPSYPMLTSITVLSSPITLKTV